MTKFDWEEQIGFVAAELRGVGYTVIESTGAEDRAELDDRVVHINSRCHPETRFYTLLHEFGHVDIYENSADDFEADHPMYYRIDSARTARSKAARVSIIAEEIEAWKRGRWLAREFELYINDRKYDRCMTNALMSYVNWAAD